MTTFQSVNFTLGPRDPLNEATTPTAPCAPVEQALRQPLPAQPHDDPGAKTPTRNSFAAANGKRALPVSPPFNGSFPSSQQPASQEQQSDLSRTDSHRSVQSTGSQDVEMGQSDDGEDVSDTESNDDGDERPSKKKKKGQRFFCKDYPPCNLSFTRSEHLARHIRKHTGERPFQCHCARRFSRLDNLRQHAQTVHVNEDIPGDSLAATGTRFQRQIRTDRVRPTGSRSRASTAGSQGPHGRGHARNLSTSSIASTVSTMSTMSNMSSMSRDTSQRRPNSLIVGDQQSPRARLTIDTMRASPQNSYNNANNSPGEANTPTSTNYANTPSSPFSSTLGSPVSFSRNLGPWGDKTPNRRLSVPSGANPFQLSPGSHGPPYLKPLAPSVASQNSSNSSLVTSPTSSIHSFSRDFNPADPDPRRRTWHPSTYTNYNYQRPATSGLTFYQTPDAPRPAFAPQAVAAAGQSQRLPGFETFDQISQRPTTPSRQSSHSTQAETPGRPLLFSASSDRSIPGPNDRRGHASWDMSLHQNLTKLDIANGTPPKEQSSHWGKQGTTEIQNAASNNSQPFQFPPGIAQSSSQAPGIAHSSSQAPGIAISSHEPQKRPSGSDHYPPAPPTTSQRSKREGWYQGPITVPQAMRAQRPSPEDSSSSDGAPTPSTASLDYQPSIVHPNGYVESQPAVPKASVPNFSHPMQHNNSYSQSNQTPRAMQFPKSELTGLDALVAVATSEGKDQSMMQQR